MILDRMLLGLQARVLLVTLGVLLILGLVVDFFESARYLFSVEGSAGDVLLFYLYKIPFLVHLLLPISLVIGTHVSFALLGRDLELRALASAGVGPLRLAGPSAVFALMVAAATLLVAELLVPPALDKTEKLMVERFGLIDQTWRFYRRHHWYQGDGDRLFCIAAVQPDGGALRSVNLYEMDASFHIRRRQDFREVRWTGDHWQADLLQERRFEGGRLLSLRKGKQETLDWPERPEHFRDLSGRPRQKTLVDLAWTIRELDRRGLSADKYRMELHNRFAFPLLGCGLVFLAFPFLTIPSRRRTLAGALIGAMGSVFGAYFIMGMATAAVSGGALSPAAGVWLPAVALWTAALAGWVLFLGRRRGILP